MLNIMDALMWFELLVVASIIFGFTLVTIKSLILMVINDMHEKNKK